MFKPLRLALILVLMLTSIGLGTARGTVRLGTEVVLCTGHGVVVTRLPDTGQTTVHLCPDMALSLLAVVAAPAVIPPQQSAMAATYQPSAFRLSVPTVLTMTRARDPPVFGA
ncbi:hypothetical protein [Paracoccus sp. JM45]|uniref:hypothetical protein n=1 Tax=Paracoccus sp. JM45 TaxID=2283626 RepID=UPI000E6C7A62|nr:hypothetical protein [Paracoccus sp. JM45]RJE80539.1 hypothetical protein DWB67_06640 [Paracoccus sp. JM45]